MASAPQGEAKASSPSAPPLGATQAADLPSNKTASIGDRPRPRVSVTVSAKPDGSTGVVALSRAQIAASPILQQYAKRGIIRMAPTEAVSQPADSTMHAIFHSRPSKRNCTGKGVNAPPARSKRNVKRSCSLSVGDGPPHVKRHRSSQHLDSSVLPRPPEMGDR